jgi:hypothetical protein
MITTTYYNDADAIDHLISKWNFNRLVIKHSVSELQIASLGMEHSNSYTTAIKEMLSKRAAQALVSKIAFTRRYDYNSFTHEFIGRVWCFTEQELQQLIKEARNV